MKVSWAATDEEEQPVEVLEGEGQGERGQLPQNHDP